MDTGDVAGIDHLRRPHAPSSANRSSREKHLIRSQVITDVATQ